MLLSQKWSRGQLIFWGRLTDDDEERSFGGYTNDSSQCERYSLQELKNEGTWQQFTPDLWTKCSEKSYYITESELVEYFGKPKVTFNNN